MPDTVHVPLIGQTSKASVWVAGLSGLGVAGYLWYKHNKNKAATPPATGTGAAGAYAYGYGSQYAYGYGAPSYGYGYSPAYGYGITGGGVNGGGGGYYGYAGYGYGSGGGGGITSNQAWLAAVTPALRSAGYTGPTIVAALGKYLAGASVDSQQYQVVTAAIGIEGLPPQSGKGGFPPAIRQAGSPAHHSSTNWREVTAPGGERLAEMAKRSDPSVTWNQVLTHNPWAVRYFGKPIPKGYRVSLPFPA